MWHLFEKRKNTYEVFINLEGLKNELKEIFSLIKTVISTNSIYFSIWVPTLHIQNIIFYLKKRKQNIISGNKMYYILQNFEGFAIDF